jgi:hypothetical protein
MNISFPSTSTIECYENDNDHIIDNVSMNYIQINIIKDTLLGKIIKILFNNEKITKKDWKMLLNYIQSISKETFNNIKIVINNLVYTSNDFIWMNSNIKSYMQRFDKKK